MENYEISIKTEDSTTAGSNKEKFYKRVPLFNSKIKLSHVGNKFKKVLMWQHF